MESFAEQMLVEIERRYKEFQLNTSIDLNDTFDEQNEHFLEESTTAELNVSNKCMIFLCKIVS